MKTTILRRTLEMMLLAVFIMMMSACSTGKKGLKSADTPKDLTILAVNDMHAAIDNFPKFAYVVDSLRQVYPDMLLVAAGDNQTGNPVNDQYTPKGWPMIALMNAVKFDLSCVGNHEFDTGQKGFVYLKEKANFDFICANYNNAGNTDVNVEPYKIITLDNGLKVAFLGLVQVNSGGIPDTHPKNVKGVVFTNPLEVGPQYAYLKDQCDVFIVLSHLGYEDDLRLTEVMEGKGLDLIIGGHTNTLIEKKQVHHGAMVTQVDWKLKYATLIQVKAKAGKVTSEDMTLLDLQGRTKENAAIRAMVDEFNDSPELKEVIASSPYELTGKQPLGYLMTDALRELSGVDMVFQNPGGVRIKHLPKGNITVMDVYRMDPFGNEFIALNLSGQEIIDFLKVAYVQDENVPEFMSGVRVEYTVDANAALKDIRVFSLDDKVLDPDKIYKVGMNSYIVAAYQFKHKDPGTSFFKVTADYVIEYLKKHKTIKNYQEEQRAVVMEK